MDSTDSEQISVFSFYCCGHEHTYNINVRKWKKSL